MADTTSGLFARYRFDETTGLVAADSSGNGNTCTLFGYTTNASWTTNGTLAGGLVFDGSNDYGVISTTGPTQTTLSAKVKLTAYPASTAAIVYYRYSGGGGWSTGIGIRSDGLAYLYVYDGASKYVYSTTVLSLGVWYHVLATFSNGVAATLYINGVQEGTPVALGTQWTGGNQWLIGYAETLAPYQTFLNATLDELRIYNRILAADAALALARGRSLGARIIGG